MKSEQSHDRAFAEALRETLTRKAEQHDPLLDAALAAGRARALAPRKNTLQRWWLAGGFALAAGLAVVVVMPQFETATPASHQAVATAAVMPDADLQLLESMDMLVAMQ